MRTKNDKSDIYYQTLWDTIEILPENLKEIETEAEKILKNIVRYKSAECLSEVPWKVITVIHMRESDLSFTHNFLNGEPLNKVTEQVPKGYGPFATWEDSVQCSFEIERSSQPKYWGIVDMLRYLEAYNGFGYARKCQNSPYLWSFSNHGVGTGKFVEDGHYDKEAIDDQVGCATMLKFLETQGY